MEQITPQEIEEAAYLFILCVDAGLGGDKTHLEVAGAAHIILSTALQALANGKQKTEISEVESGAGVGIEPEQVPGVRHLGGQEEGPEGVREDEQGETTPSPKEQPKD